MLNLVSVQVIIVVMQLTFIPQGDLMKIALRIALTTCAIAAWSSTSSAADAPMQPHATPAVAANPAASGALAAPKIAGKIPAANAKSIANKSGDNQYPGTTVIPPKPPKKEALDAAALKAQGAVAK